MLLTETNPEINVVKGEYNIGIDLNGGTSATMEYKVEGSPWIAVPDGAFTADTGEVINLPTCLVRCIFVGDVQVYLSLTG